MAVNRSNVLRAMLGLFAVGVVLWAVTTAVSTDRRIPPGRERVVFWHFWGGQERRVVRDVVDRFNAVQEQYWVDEVPVPGQNLDMKFFMALAGGDFPDLLNQDEQIIAQWADRGVLLCGSGVGASIAANKLKGVRAAVCHDAYSAHQGVEHDDMNVLCLGARIVGQEVATELVNAFVSAGFTGEERHQRRLNKLLDMESDFG